MDYFPEAASLILLLALACSQAAFFDDHLSCENPSLSKGDLHVVIAGYDYDYMKNHYIFDFGMTNANYYFYRRILPRTLTTSRYGPCGSEIFERLLLPNHGRDAAAFFDYAYENYNNPPEVVMFLHGHAAISWHITCESVLTRVLYYYREAVNSGENLRMITLTSKRLSGVNYSDWFGRRSYTRRQLNINIKNEWKGLPAIDAEYAEGCHDIFTRHNVTKLSAGNRVHSCCASFIMPGQRLKWYPRSFYKALRAYHLNETFNDFYQSRICFEFILYDMFGDVYRSQQDVDDEKAWYISASNLLKSKGYRSDYIHRLKRCRTETRKKSYTSKSYMN